ncbi:hypothetical protein GOP47_0017817 [Adiantum capillus-veneris]|uniref:Uncharacterized protein n=1 Tax=Adiantum capillus-veneris TaxID=13818 RepID=A0A9D4UH28_ADICA|nr:hypothetical protein GOP47_0017817 [Adiantum capillus-veneris]
MADGSGPSLSATVQGDLGDPVVPSSLSNGLNEHVLQLEGSHMAESEAQQLPSGPFASHVTSNFAVSNRTGQSNSCCITNLSKGGPASSKLPENNVHSLQTSNYATKPVPSKFEDKELDLLYDPILDCYYDPKTNRYYELK